MPDQALNTNKPLVIKIPEQEVAHLAERVLQQERAEEARRHRTAAAARLAALAEDARRQYLDELAAGGEPVYPAWVDDVTTVCANPVAPEGQRATVCIMQEPVSDGDLLRICQQFNPGQDLDLAKAVRAEVLSALRAPAAGEVITNEMIQAGAKAAREYFERTGGNSPAVIYRAMRAAASAAPKASSASGGGATA